jgi:hypothetical protein
MYFIEQTPLGVNGSFLDDAATKPVCPVDQSVQDVDVGAHALLPGFTYLITGGLSGGRSTWISVTIRRRGQGTFQLQLRILL